MHRSACDSRFMQALLLKLFFFLFSLLATLLARLGSLDNCFCDFLSAAVLFATSPSSRVCKSLHIWKHRQQGVGARDHCRIRWVGGKSVASGVLFLCLPEPPTPPAPTPKTPKQNNTLVPLSDLLMLINEYIFTRCSNIFSTLFFILWI